MQLSYTVFHQVIRRHQFTGHLLTLLSRLPDVSHSDQTANVFHKYYIGIYKLSAFNRAHIKNYLFTRNFHMPSCVCPSLWSQVGVLLKWLKLVSRKQRHMIIEGLYFAMP